MEQLQYKIVIMYEAKYGTTPVPRCERLQGRIWYNSKVWVSTRQNTVCMVQLQYQGVSVYKAEYGTTPVQTCECHIMYSTTWVPRCEPLRGSYMDSEVLHREGAWLLVLGPYKEEVLEGFIYL